MLTSILIVPVIFGVFAWMRPTFTPSMKDEAGIASLETIDLGGMEQWILIRRQDVSNPVLLWLHGGPGAAQIPVARHFNGGLEEHFIVVHWDQRGAGKSNPAEFDESTMTFEQYVADAHDLTLLLKSRFGQNKIYLVGHSWGSQVGIRLAQMYPEDYYAYVGVSQVVNAARAQQMGYDWLMKQVQAEDERSELESIGQPPFTDHERFVHYIQKIDAYGGGFDVRFTQLAWIALRAPEYNLRDVSAWMRGSNRGSSSMWNSSEYRSFDAVNDIPKLETSIYFFNGQMDYNTPLQLVESYFEVLEAPYGKHLAVFETSAHTPFMAEADRFNQEMVQVKDETYQP